MEWSPSVCDRMVDAWREPQLVSRETLDEMRRVLSDPTFTAFCVDRLPAEIESGDPMVELFRRIVRAHLESVGEDDDNMLLNLRMKSIQSSLSMHDEAVDYFWARDIVCHELSLLRPPGDATWKTEIDRAFDVPVGTPWLIAAFGSGDFDLTAAGVPWAALEPSLHNNSVDADADVDDDHVGIRVGDSANDGSANDGSANDEKNSSVVRLALSARSDEGWSTGPHFRHGSTGFDRVIDLLENCPRVKAQTRRAYLQEREVAQLLAVMHCVRTSRDRSGAINVFDSWCSSRVSCAFAAALLDHRLIAEASLGHALIARLICATRPSGRMSLALLTDRCDEISHLDAPSRSMVVAKLADDIDRLAHELERISGLLLDDREVNAVRLLLPSVARYERRAKRKAPGDDGETARVTDDRDREHEHEHEHEHASLIRAYCASVKR